VDTYDKKNQYHHYTRLTLKQKYLISSHFILLPITRGLKIHVEIIVLISRQNIILCIPKGTYFLFIHIYFLMWPFFIFYGNIYVTWLSCRTYVLCLLKSWNQRVSCEDINNVTYDSEYIIVKNDKNRMHWISKVHYKF
jgi:hypothetical protein